MKVIAINSSPRKEGNTKIIINEIFKVLNQNGIETELVHIGGKGIHGCTACGSCKKTLDKKCIINDMVNETIEKMVNADGIILGTPVYFADMTADMKAFIERVGMVASANGALFKHKVGAAVVAVRRGGAVHTFDSLNHFLHYTQMYQVGASYWNMVHGREIGESLNDEEGILNMQVLGENMAWILKKIHQ